MRGDDARLHSHAHSHTRTRIRTLAHAIGTHIQHASSHLFRHERTVDKEARHEEGDSHPFSRNLGGGARFYKDLTLHLSINKFYPQSFQGRPIVQHKQDGEQDMRARTQKACRRAISSVMCVACCCPRSVHGLLNMLRDDRTREFALAVIIGETFRTFVDGVCAYLIIPIGYAIFSPRSWDVKCIGSCEGLLLVSGGYDWDPASNSSLVLQYRSSEEAVADGALVLRLKLLIKAFVTFVLTLMTTYWFFDWLDASAKLQEKMLKAASHIKYKAAKFLPDQPDSKGEEQAEASEMTLTSKPTTALAADTVILDVDQCKPDSARVCSSSAGPLVSAANDASWVDLIDQMTSTDGAMKELHSKHPQIFYLHGENIRRMLDYRLHRRWHDGSAGVMQEE